MMRQKWCKSCSEIQPNNIETEQIIDNFYELAYNTGVVGMLSVGEYRENLCSNECRKQYGLKLLSSDFPAYNVKERCYTK